MGALDRTRAAVLLGLEPGQRHDMATITRAWKRKVFLNHPDKNQAANATGLTQQLNEAKEVMLAAVEADTKAFAWKQEHEQWKQEILRQEQQRRREHEQRMEEIKRQSEERIKEHERKLEQIRRDTEQRAREHEKWMEEFLKAQEERHTKDEMPKRMDYQERAAKRTRKEVPVESDGTTGSVPNSIPKTAQTSASAQKLSHSTEVNKSQTSITSFFQPVAANSRV